MSKTNQLTVALVAVCLPLALAQDPSPAPSSTPSAGGVSISAPPSPYSDSNPPPTAAAIVTPAIILAKPTTNPTVLYRVASKAGILRLNGAEIVLNGIPTPTARFVSWQDGHMDVLDTEADGSVSTTSWDISNLTAPFQPGSSIKGGHTNQFLTGDPEDGTWISPDLLPSEKPLMVTTDVSEDLPVLLGSVFVDDANRIFFTPPTAPVLFSLPNDVFEISCVTHLASNDTIVAEWTKLNEDNYHLVKINLSSLTVVSDFMPGDSLYVQKMLTWIDDNNVLGLANGHGFERYTTANLSSKTVTVTAASKDGVTAKVQQGAVVVYSISP